MAIEVFISYAHEDHALLKELEKHLANLKRQDIISSWYDGDITPGAEWESEIKERLLYAQIILLLISADFIYSDFCSRIEMKQAIDRHNAGEACVIPVLLRPTDWQGAPFDKLKMLPTDAKAVTKWRSRDDAFADVVRGIRAAIQELTSTRKTANPSLASDTTSVGVAQVPIWNVPYQRNPLFTGREHILERLAMTFHTGKTTALARPLAISGLGGIGKTQTTIEYAYRFRERYGQVLWAKADTYETLFQDYVAIAQLLQLPEQHLQDQPQIVEAVKRWLREQRQWLLILDNADDLTMVRDFLPSGGKGHLLLTTRAHAIGRIAQRIEVAKMEPEEGALFVLRRAGILEAEEPLNKASSRDQANALVIVQEMDGLPLALDQAGAYIEETGCGLAGYLTLYQQRRMDLLQARGEYTYDHPESVATTWSLSFEKVEQANPAAADLLRLCAFLAPDAIPEEIITKGAADLTPMLQSLASDPFLLDAAIKELLRYSLIQRDAEEKLLSLHRLVQAVIKEGMDQNAQRQWAERTMRAVHTSLPAVELGNWQAWERVVTHAQTCAELLEHYVIQLPEAAALLYQTGWYLTERARYDEAEPLLVQAYAMSEQAQGPEHLDTARDADSLANLYQAQGRYAEAEPLYQRDLHINEQQLGPEHPDVAPSLNGLANLYRKQSKYGEAELLYQRDLRIWEQQLGPEHPDVANVLTNLANFYQEQGKYVEAESLYQRALHINEQQFGSEHPFVAISLSSLANLYSQQSKYAEAEALYLRALRIWEQQLGPEHPFVAISLNGLADLYTEQGKYTEAEPLYQRSLAIQEQTFVPDHPSIVTTLEQYASLLRQMQRNEEAAQLEERVREIRAWSTF